MLEVDFCVVGGGMAGLIASIAAARHGASVVLMHDRPVL
ncbi:MAG: FAD-dependent oxidoreductase, partial [Promethearchaeota archaeon]